MEEDEKGLKVEITPPNTQWARDFMESIKRGDVDQMSFGFDVLEDAWDKSKKIAIRTLQKLKLFEVSPVTFPAYPQTSLQARAKALTDCGINFDGLLGIIYRMQCGQKLDKSERNFINSTIKELQSLTVSDVDDNQNPEKGKGSHAMRRNKLLLMEKEIKQRRCM